MMQYVRSVFKHAYERDLIDRPVRFGPGSSGRARRHCACTTRSRGRSCSRRTRSASLARGRRRAVKGDGLLGINCGFGNADCGNLPLYRPGPGNAAGWTIPRPKTGIPRRCPLWPETVAALREASGRPARAEGRPSMPGWCSSRSTAARGPRTTDARRHHKEMRQAARRAGHQRPKGLGFYTLRHTFRTVADEAKDQPAADYIMGHEVAHMSSVYRETISDERLKAVTDHVRRGYFARHREENNRIRDVVLVMNPGGYNPRVLFARSATP